MVLLALVVLLGLTQFTHVSTHIRHLDRSSYDFENAVVTVERNAGSTAKLKCNADVHRVHWTKNGRRLPCRKGGCQLTLKLTKLSSKDEGLYQCWEPHGLQSNPTFDLKVRPEGRCKGGAAAKRLDKRLPQLDGPGSLSAPAGSTATLRCSVRSATQPSVQWVRLLSEEPAVEGAVRRRPHDALKYGGANYEVLSSSGVALFNHTWTTKLVLKKLNQSSAGYYACVAANSCGFQYKGGYVTVIETAENAFVTGYGGGRSSEVLYIEVVLIATVFMLLATTALALLYLAHWNRRHTRASSNL